MFDLGLTEIILIMIVGLIAVGPKEIPSVMQGAGRLFRRLTYVRYAFSQQFEDFMKISELGDITEQVNFEAAPQDLKTDEDDEDAAYFEMSDETQTKTEENDESKSD